MQRTTWKASPILLMVVLGLSACLDEPASTEEAESRVLVQHFDAHSYYKEPARWVIRDAAAWEQTWTQLAGAEEPLPAVDFAQEMLLVAAMGERSSSGYRIEIEYVFVDAGGISVQVLETSPGPRCVVFPVLTAPVTVVAIPRTGGSVSWVERSRTWQC